MGAFNLDRGPPWRYPAVGNGISDYEKRERKMIKEHDLVVLLRDLPDHGLEVGDVGVAVALYPDGSLEVEFVNAAGETLGVITLMATDFRPLEGSEILHVRSLAPA
jgi:methyl coenzyme M reductase subunit C-like uncharacterized protein (methanogenesis marker protein 7)